MGKYPATVAGSAGRGGRGREAGRLKQTLRKPTHISRLQTRSFYLRLY